MRRCGCSKLNSISLGFAVGIAYGIFLFILAWAAWSQGVGVLIVQQMAVIFPGYEMSLHGGLLGFAWGLLHGFFFGLIVGIVYNLCMCCRPCRCNCCKTVVEKV